MTTAREVIRTALHLIRRVDEDEEPTAAQEKDALAALNKMAFGMKAKGADLGWQKVKAATTIPLADEFIEDLEYLLAKRLAPEYSATLTPEVALAASGALKRFQGHFKRIVPLRPAPGLLPNYVEYGAYDPETDQSVD